MLTVAYDGTNYHGWQIQPNVITIESVLNEALSLLFKEEIHVIGASRTDTGVHALGNIAVFDTEARMPGDKVSYALNQRLPQDIRIEDSREVPLDFHPRHCNSRKTYEYKILNREFPLPTYRLYAHFTYVPLDVTRMQQAADYLVGEHDFKSFCSVNNSSGNNSKNTLFGKGIEGIGYDYHSCHRFRLSVQYGSYYCRHTYGSGKRQYEPGADTPNTGCTGSPKGRTYSAGMRIDTVCI